MVAGRIGKPDGRANRRIRPCEAGVEVAEQRDRALPALREQLLDRLVAHGGELRLLGRLLRDPHELREVLGRHRLRDEEVLLAGEEDFGRPRLPTGTIGPGSFGEAVDRAVGREGDLRLPPQFAVDRVAGKAAARQADLELHDRGLVRRNRRDAGRPAGKQERQRENWGGKAHVRSSPAPA